MIPFFIYYSMFGLQRIGDLAWAAGDIGAKGFMIGGTAGRTTLNGEGLQHQDGHSHLLAYTVPNLCAYDPAFAYELAVLVREGIKRMYEEQRNEFFYITVMNENYAMPPMPEGAKDGIIKGMYKYKAASKKSSKNKAQLFGSGTILNEVLKAQEILEKDYNVSADVWSVTSYKELRRDALDVERWNMLNPTKKQKVSYISQILKDEEGVFVAASDYVKTLPDSIAKWIPGKLTSLGTDGFGRSESREALRDFFEVDHRHIVFATLGALAKDGKVKNEVLEKAKKQLNIKSDKPNPIVS
jgi:pyruvate dehydrogenase E1 component